MTERGSLGVVRSTEGGEASETWPEVKKRGIELGGREGQANLLMANQAVRGLKFTKWVEARRSGVGHAQQSGADFLFVLGEVVVEPKHVIVRVLFGIIL
jgi:hypothetical protein